MDVLTMAAAEERGLAAMEEGGGCLRSLIDTGNVENHRLYLARRTGLKMLHDRGYGITVTDIEMPLSNFRASFGDANPDIAKLKIDVVLLRDPSQRVLDSVNTIIEIIETSFVLPPTMKDLQFGRFLKNGEA